MTDEKNMENTNENSKNQTPPPEPQPTAKIEMIKESHDEGSNKKGVRIFG